MTTANTRPRPAPRARPGTAVSSTRPRPAARPAPNTRERPERTTNTTANARPRPSSRPAPNARPRPERPRPVRAGTTTSTTRPRVERRDRPVNPAPRERARPAPRVKASDEVAPRTGKRVERRDTKSLAGLGVTMLLVIAMSIFAFSILRGDPGDLSDGQTKEELQKVMEYKKPGTSTNTGILRGIK